MLFKAPAAGLRACGASSCGLVRSNNEDNFFADGLYPSAKQIDDISERIVIETGLTAISVPHIYAVFDGMGGESRGELASGTAAAFLAERWKEISSTRQMLDAAAGMNAAVRSAAAELGLKRCGTTAAIALICDSSLYAFNAGDSRIYFLRGRSFSMLTKDDTQAQMFVDAGLLSKSQSAGSPMKHMLTQYIGMDSAERDLDIHVRHSARLSPGDRVLICSDGVTDMLDDRSIEDILRESPDARGAALGLIDAAVGNGGKDNATALVIEAV